MPTKFSLVRSNFNYSTHLFNAPVGITIAFSRGNGSIDTVEPSGSLVDGSDPRFDGPVLMPTINTPENALPSGAPSNPNGILLASGVGADGVQPIMVWLHKDDSSGHKLYIFVGGSMPSTWFPLPSPHVQRALHARTADDLIGSGSFTFYDLFSSSQNYTVNGKRVARGLGCRGLSRRYRACWPDVHPTGLAQSGPL